MKRLSYAIARLYLRVAAQPVHDAAADFLRRHSGAGEFHYKLFLAKKCQWACTPARIRLMPGCFWQTQLKRAELAFQCSLCPVCIIGYDDGPYGAYAIAAINQQGVLYQITEDETAWELGSEEAALRDFCSTVWRPPPENEVSLIEEDDDGVDATKLFDRLRRLLRSSAILTIHIAYVILDHLPVFVILILLIGMSVFNRKL